MASIISASTTSGTALSLTADTSGVLEIKTGVTPTTALTLDASQNATFANVINGNGSGITSINAANVSSGVLSQAQGGTGTTTGYYGFKNRIINGAVVISQYNGTSSVTPTSSSYVIDRWKASMSVASKFSVQQNAGGLTPAVTTGFTNYLGATSTSAYTVGAAETFNINQTIEGYNIADLAWGTASAKTVTLSFWAYSSLTGTFGGSLKNGTSARSYPFTYSIPVANTWTQISVTVAGDTSGTWATDNTGGMILTFSLGSGSTFSGTAGAWATANYTSATGATSVVGTSGATFYITGVQLEVGSTATSFDYRPYGTEELLCKRYYTKFISFGSAYAGIGCGVVEQTTGTSVVVKYPVTMRASPTASQSNTGLYDGSGTVRAVTSLSTNYQGNDALNINIVASGGGLTIGRASTFITNSSAGYFDLSAEL